MNLSCRDGSLFRFHAFLLNRPALCGLLDERQVSEAREACRVRCSTCTSTPWTPSTASCRRPSTAPRCLGPRKRSQRELGLALLSGLGGGFGAHGAAHRIGPAHRLPLGQSLSAGQYAGSTKAMPCQRLGEVFFRDLWQACLGVWSPGGLLVVSLWSWYS